MNKLPTSFILIPLLLFIGCTGARRFTPPDPVPDDRYHVAERPAELETHIMWDGFKRQMVQPGSDLFDLGYWARKLVGSPKEAYNVDAFGEVPNSSWFTNRNTVTPLSPEEVFRGPNTVDGPDLDHLWTVVKAKTLGITPGFVIKDGRGDRYVVKLDPPGFNELNSGAEIVLTKLLHAAGYFVPENFAVEFDPEILSVGEKVKFIGKGGEQRFMTEDDLADIIERVQLTGNGKVRAMASKYISGRPIGPFFFKGTRKDDPNDFIPHEHRRELRGFRVICAWLSHYDTNVSNFLDGFVTEDDRSYVRHYLIDFGAALGSHPSGAKPADRGTEPYMDPVHMLNKTAELGLVVRARDHQDSVQYPSVGRFSSKNFHPKSFKFIFPTRAFELYTPRDAYWGAKIVMSFTKEQIRAAVKAANYSDPKAAEYIVQTLIERRDIVSRYWFNRMAPLDNFELTEDGLSFEDLAINSGLEPAESTHYRYRVLYSGSPVSTWQEMDSNEAIRDLPRRNSSDIQSAVELQVKRGNGKWSHSVVAYLNPAPDNRWKLIGVKRDV